MRPGQRDSLLQAEILSTGRSHFLDADDLLEPDVMLKLAKVWRPGVPKFITG
jgi:hypothetical protein